MIFKFTMQYTDLLIIFIVQSPHFLFRYYYSISLSQEVRYKSFFWNLEMSRFIHIYKSAIKTYFKWLVLKLLFSKFPFVTANRALHLNVFSHLLSTSARGILLSIAII